MAAIAPLSVVKPSKFASRLRTSRRGRMLERHPRDPIFVRLRASGISAVVSMTPSFPRTFLVIAPTAAFALQYLLGDGALFHIRGSIHGRLVERLQKMVIGSRQACGSRGVSI
jgi:hypothetical protein